MKIILTIFLANFSLQYSLLNGNEVTNLRTGVIDSPKIAPFKPGNRIVIDYLDKSQQFPERELASLDINSLKTEVDQLIAVYGWTSKLDPKNNILLVTYQGSNSDAINYIFRARIESKQAKGIQTQISYIVFDNKPEERDTEMFAKYRNHHAYFRRAIGTVDSTENRIKQTSFIKDSISSFKEMSDKVKLPANVKVLYEFIKQTVANYGKNDLVVSEKFILETAIGFDLVKRDNQKLIFQVVLYSIGQNYFGADFTLRHNSYILIVPKENVESSKEDIERILNLPEIEADQAPLELTDLPKLINDDMKSICQTDTPIIKNINSHHQSDSILRLEFDRSSARNAPDRLEDVCPFIGTEMTIVKYNYGYMQYFQLFYESKYLQQEGILFAAKVDTTAGLEKSLEILKKSVSYIQHAQAESISEITISIDEIKDVLKASFNGEDPEEVKLSQSEEQQILAAKSTDSKKWLFKNSSIEVLLVIINSEYLIKLRKLGEEGLMVSEEITLPVINGYDQKQSLAMRVEQFLEKVKSISQT